MREAEWIQRSSADNALGFATRQGYANRRHVISDVRVTYKSTVSGKLCQVYEALNQYAFVAGALQIDGTATKFKSTATMYYTIDGVSYSLGATGAMVFSAGHVVSAGTWGAILVQVNAAGTISTAVVSATQAYTSAGQALAHLPTPAASTAAWGYILVNAGGSDWTANSSDMTNGSGATAVTFTDLTTGASLLHEEYIYDTSAMPFLNGYRCTPNRSIVVVTEASGASGNLAKANLRGYSTGG